MKGFGVNTFVLVNAEGKRTFVKYHWRPQLGAHGLVWDEALKLGGQDPDYLRRDLAEYVPLRCFLRQTRRRGERLIFLLSLNLVLSMLEGSPNGISVFN